mgnify:CR=1 FL=1
MSSRIFKNYFIPIFLSFFSIKSFSEEINKFQKSNIKWEKINRDEIEIKKIKWDYLTDKEFRIEYNNLLKNYEDFQKTKESNTNIISKESEYLKPSQIIPTIQLNNFLSKNASSSNFISMDLVANLGLSSRKTDSAAALNSENAMERYVVKFEGSRRERIHQRPPTRPRLRIEPRFPQFCNKILSSVSLS